MADALTTAIQLRDDANVVCSLIHGVPHSVVRSSRGPVALFDPGRLVAYQLEVQGRPRVWVFRTLRHFMAPAAAVPGVHPHVSLLLEVRTRGRAERVRRLFDYLAREGRDPDRLSDAFFLRAGLVLGGRITGKNVVLSLLRHEQH